MFAWQSRYEPVPEDISVPLLLVLLLVLLLPRKELLPRMEADVEESCREEES